MSAIPELILANAGIFAVEMLDLLIPKVQRIVRASADSATAAADLAAYDVMHADPAGPGTGAADRDRLEGQVQAAALELRLCWGEILAVVTAAEFEAIKKQALAGLRWNLTGGDDA